MEQHGDWLKSYALSVKKPCRNGFFQVLENACKMLLSPRDTTETAHAYTKLVALTQLLAADSEIR